MSAHPAELRSLHLAMLDAVLAGAGLGEVAALAARECGGPVALAVPRLELVVGSPEVSAPALGRLRAYALARCAGRVAPVPSGVVAEVPIASGQEWLGVVLLLGGAPPSGDVLDRLRLVSVAALTEIALARSASAAPDESASATLLDALADGAPLSREDVVRRAARAGCDLRGGAIALCCAPQVSRPHHVAALVRDDWPGALAQHVVSSGGPRLYALLPARAAATGGLEALADRLARHGPVGISAPCTDPAGLGRAMESAALAVDLGDGTGVAVADRAVLLARYEASVAPLARYDDQYATELVDTLSRVLAADVDTVAVDLAIPAHRVRYRLEKARELSGLDAATPAGRRALSLGLRCRRVLAPSLPR